MSAFSREMDSSGPRSGWLPDQWAAACALALPADGAGLSVTFAGDRRLPAGAADEVSALAERLQFSTGEGPCFTAVNTRSVVCASARSLADRWPVYWAELSAQTPFRSVVALPVGGPLAGFAALSLFFTPPRDALLSDRDDVIALGLAVGERLVTDLASGTDQLLGQPAWLSTPAVQRRQQVWQAVGVLNGQGETRDSAESLALLRSYAYAEGVDLEAAAARFLQNNQAGQDETRN